MTTPLFTRLQMQSLIRRTIHTHGVDAALDIVYSAVEKETAHEIRNDHDHAHAHSLRQPLGKSLLPGLDL
jgi:hypothetical protein